MSGRGKKPKKPALPVRTTKSKKSGLLFPVSRIHRYLKQGHYAERVSPTAAVYLAAVLEYLTVEVLELSEEAAQQNKKQRITPRHIQVVVSNDEELSQLFTNVIIPGGGVLPNIQPALLPKKTAQMKEAEGDGQSQEF